jgi:hypothetical protein
VIALTVAAALGAFAGCSVGGQDGVTRINPADLGGLDQTVPDASPAPASAPTVLSPPTTSAQPVSTPPLPSRPSSTVPVTVPATMYFIAGEGLVAVPMELPESAVQSVRSYLDTLAAGPPPSAVERGIRSAIPPDLVESVQIRSDGITIDLDGELFSSVDTQDQQLLIGQLVLSITDLPDAGGLRRFNRVRFTLDGAPLPVLRRDNSRTAPGEFVTADDYSQLLVGMPSGAAAQAVTTTVQ